MRNWTPSIPRQGVLDNHGTSKVERDHYGMEISQKFHSAHRIGLKTFFIHEGSDATDSLLFNIFKFSSKKYPLTFT